MFTVIVSAAPSAQSLTVYCGKESRDNHSAPAPRHRLSLNTPNFEKTLIVVIKQGGIAEGAIGSVINIIDNLINRIVFLIAKWSP